METAQFLARAVAPGNYLAVQHNHGAGTAANSVRLFPRDRIADAAGYVGWIAGKGWDVYHAQASFNLAVPNGSDGRNNPKYKGSREASNAQRVKSLWIDCDVKRAGDKKDTSNSFASQSAAMLWIAKFKAQIGLPRPSMVVSSGYGLHVYWVLEDDLSVADWQQWGDALSSALVAEGFPGDAGISRDSVRLLRPPGTVNVKSGAPVPVFTLDKLSGPDVPNSVVQAALQPYVGLIVRKGAQAAQQAQAGQAQIQGTVSSIFQKTGTGGATQMPNMVAAATANLPARQDRTFARMAEPGQCAQVAASLATGGAGDGYPLWYLGFISAAVFTSDGARFIHQLSSGDPRYNQAATDAAMLRATVEQQRKGHGWPTCAQFERSRAAICKACPHYGRLTSPLDLATEGGDLPMHYRRARGGIEVFMEEPRTGGFWIQIIKGDVYAPVLDEQPGRGSTLMFKYARNARVYDMVVVLQDLTNDTSAIYRMMQPQQLVLQPGTELRWRTFLLAWLDLLEDKGAKRTERIAPFGWIKKETEHLGWSYAGMFYRADGSVESAPGGDRTLLEKHQPQGNLAEWRRAADFATQGRPDLQVIVAAAFAAPLVHFSGQKGLLLSAWSRDSGLGKTSAITVGQAVWGAPGVGMSLTDTHNSVRYKIGETRNLPAFWDETRVGTADDVAKFVEFIFAITQGKDKSRLDRDANLRPVGEWETMVVCCANNPMMDNVVQMTAGTEAGALRVFELHLTAPPRPQNAFASKTVQLATVHYGRAGEVYSRWLATNYDVCGKLVTAQLQAVINKTGALQSERMHAATIATVLAGARIANKLGLMDFDIPAVEALMLRTFELLRAGRGAQLLVGPQGYDLQELLAGFWSENQRGRIVTDWFGRGNKSVGVVLHPLGGTIEIQVSQGDLAMRLHQGKFFAYLRKLGMPPTDVVAAMERSWGAMQARKVMGTGTPYGGGGNLRCIEIPLTYKDLASYLQVDPAQALASASAAKTANQAQSRAGAMQAAQASAHGQQPLQSGTTP